MKWLTIGFAAFLIVIIACANTGAAGDLFQVVRTIPAGDKICHFLFVGTMALLLNLCLSASTVRVGAIPVLKGSLIVLVVVTLEELSQGFIARRSCSLTDLLANYAGILVLGSLCLLTPPRVAETESPPPPAL